MSAESNFDSTSSTNTCLPPNNNGTTLSSRHSSVGDDTNHPPITSSANARRPKKRRQSRATSQDSYSKTTNDNNNSGNFNNNGASSSSRSNNTRKSNGTAGVANRIITEDLDRQCWICFANLKDDQVDLQDQPALNKRWVRPCQCRGTAKWVHQQCLQRWVDEKQKGDLLVRVACDRCATAYRILYPEPNSFVFVVERLDHALANFCPLGAALVVGGAAYWCAVTCGAVTMFVSMGHRPALKCMERADPIFLLLTLPALPIGLLCLNSLPRYTDDLVGVLARLTLDDEPTVLEQRLALQRQRRRSASVVFCESLALPIVSRVIGDWFFKNRVTSQLSRTLLGAATFLFARSLCRLYFQYNQLGRQTKRHILDYYDPADVGRPATAARRHSAAQLGAPNNNNNAPAEAD